MKIKYEFMTGERLELEVDDNIGEIMIEMEKTQSRRNRTETRRHNSLEFIDGAVATVMALDRAIRNEGNSGGSVYDDRGILIF